MKCEVCHLNEASRSIKRVIEGDERELFVCSACSRTSPHAGTVPASLTDVLFSLGMQVGGDDKIEDSVCPACGLSRNELRQKHRMGCPNCFDVFATDIRTFLSVQQPLLSGAASEGDGSDHADRDALKAALEKAVAEERYEDAAMICENMRQLGAQTEADGAHGGD